MDGEPVKSCTVLAQDCEGAEVRTIEGMAEKDGSLGRVQQAFQEALGPEVAVYSQPELVAAALADYLERHPDKLGEGREAEVQDAVHDLIGAGAAGGSPRLPTEPTPGN